MDLSSSAYTSNGASASDHDLVVGSSSNTNGISQGTGPSNLTVVTDTTAIGSRPVALGRSVSSPHDLPRSPSAKKRLSAALRGISGTVHGTAGRSGYGGHTPRTPSQQWNIFGQLMEDDVGVTSPGITHSASRRSVRSTQRADAAPTASASGVEGLHITIPEQRVDMFPEIPDVLHSPVSTSLRTSKSGAFMTPRSRRRTYFDPDRTDGDASDDAYTEISSSDSETEEDSDDMTPTPSAFQQPHPPEPAKTWTSRLKLPELPTMPLLYRNILKCSIAYFIASLFTYYPPFSNLIWDLTPFKGDSEYRPSPSAHMVATVSVYFNPAKTLGGMVEADLYCLIGLCFSAGVCLISLTMFRGLDHLDHSGASEAVQNLAHIGVVFWIGVAMSVLAWMKVWMGKPSFNTACSMTVISMFVVLIKEGGLRTLGSVTLIAIFGAITSNVVNSAIWPQSATKNLQTNMIKTLDSFGVLLDILTSTFLLEDKDADGDRIGDGKPGGGRKVTQEKLQRAVEAHQSSFTSLKKNLDEARSEWAVIGGGGSLSTSRHFLMDDEAPLLGAANGHEAVRHSSHLYDETESGNTSIWDRLQAARQAVNGGEDKSSRRAYEDAVDSLNRLAQHLNGLRSGTRLQSEIMGAGVAVLARKGGSDVDEDEDEDEDEEKHVLKAAAVMFGELVDELGPPLKALSTTCTSSLKRLRESFSDAYSRSKHHTLRRSKSKKKSKKDTLIKPHEFEELVSDIQRALIRFESTSNHALLRMYRRNANITTTSASGSAQPGDEVASGANEVLKGIGRDSENVFLVYFFIFTLQEFSRELVSLVDAMERIYVNEQIRKRRGAWYKRLGRSFKYAVLSTGRWIMRFGRRRVGEPRRRDTVRRGVEGLRRRITKPGLKRSISGMVQAQHKPPPTPSFPKVRPHAPNTVQTPWSNLTLLGRVKAKVWALGQKAKDRTIKYAVKTGMAAAVLVAPAFFEATRPTFVEYYGDWALISYFIVISPTIGATNNLSWHRILGTIIGAVVAASIWILFEEQPIPLAIFGFFFSIPCFYFIVATPKYVSAARFVLLTYNLTCLYCYNLRERDLSVLFIAYRRALSVGIGVTWAALVSRFWWPAEARRELGKSLSEFCLNLGWLYTRLVASNSFAPEYREERRLPEDEDHPTEETALLRPVPKPANANNNSIEEFMAMELHLQIKLIELQGLLAQTQHEPRLKGPFPVKLYRGILTKLQTILDRLHSMRCVTTKEEWYTSVRKDFIIPVNRERRDMVGNIILLFSIIASSFRLKAPLPPYLPPAEKSRQRLVEAIKRLDVVRSRDIKGSRQLLFFAYALTMKGVTIELEALGRTLQTAFGVIGQSADEFEALFSNPDALERPRLEYVS